MTPSAGSVLGPYEIGAALGGGGMGEVYRARDLRLQREVAIKVLPEARRALAGFESGAAIESFAFTPAGKQLVVSRTEIRSQLVAAKGVAGLRR